MNRRIVIVVTALAACFSLLFLVGCAASSGQEGDGESKDRGFEQIDAEAAKKIMDEESDYVILDVRTQDEYDQGHIPGAVLLPHDAVSKDAERILPRKDQLVLVYCRSGNRSKQASQALVDLGYTNIVEFGGINDWPYDIER